VLDHRPQRQCRHVVQQPDQQHGADQQRHEQRAVGGQRARGDRHALLGRQRPAMASTGTITPKRPSHIAMASSVL
jgi:hypothetical protein